MKLQSFYINAKNFVCVFLQNVRADESSRVTVIAQCQKQECTVMAHGLLALSHVLLLVDLTRSTRYTKMS